MTKLLRYAVTGLMATAAIAGALVVTAVPGAATPVGDETAFRAAWTNAAETQIDLTADIVLAGGVGCTGAATRSSATSITVNGHGFSITQACTTSVNNAVLQQAGTGALTFQNVTITGGNSAVGGGGVTGPSDITVINSTITGNSSFLGGGGISTSGNVTVTNSMISGNSTDKAGGGVSGGTITVSGSTISGNSAGGDLGGIAGSGLFAQGAVTITNSTITGNGPTGGAGGGVLTSGGVTVTNSTFTLNTADTGGAAISAAGPVALTNSTVSGNTGSGTVGAVSGAAGVNLVYSTVVSNTSGTSANVTAGPLTSFGSVVALPLGGGTNCSLGTTSSNGWNFSDDTSCGFTNTTSGDRQNGNPGPGPLANNGGPTQTHMPARPGPLPDAIPGAHCQDFGAAGISHDQRGVFRPQGPGCDIGSVEAPPPAPVVCPAAAGASLGAGSLAGAEGVVAVAPVGFYGLFRRRRRGVSSVPRRDRARSVVTWLMVAGVAVAVLAACQPVKKAPPCRPAPPRSSSPSPLVPLRGRNRWGDHHARTARHTAHRSARSGGDRAHRRSPLHPRCRAG